ncbi:MAG: vWA domain-containing protein [Planctomycetota bacterium]
MADTSEEARIGTRQAARHNMQTLPSNRVAKELGKVYVGEKGNERHVEFTIWVQELSGAKAEGWKTGLALDASASMKDWYGRNLAYVGQGIPRNVLDEYERNGWIEHREDDGQKFMSFQAQAYKDAINRGFLKYSENIVQPLARDFIAYLAHELDSNGRAAVVYWACGDGGAYEVVGEFSADECKSLDISGPKKVTFGLGTKLTPALDYFCNTYATAANAMFVFITDGRLEDLEQVKQVTTELAKAIESGSRNPVKCVLIGVGDKIDEAQMEELDDLETGTDVDIWDHKIAQEMRALSEIMVELVDDVVSSMPANIYDDQGNIVKKFADGIPASVQFAMPITSRYFELEVGSQRIRQPVVANA